MKSMELRVAVLRGGISAEREVSLESGRAVLEALAGAAERGVGPRERTDVVIEPDGRWTLRGRTSSALAALGLLGEIDLFFLALHGGQGENGAVQGLLRSVGRRFTGSDVIPSAICLDKVVTREFARSIGLQVAPGLVCDRAEWLESRDEILARARALGPTGWSVKPRRGGSSVDVVLLEDPAQLNEAVEVILEAGDEALIEARILGIELTCGVLGNSGQELRSLTPIEIQPREGHFFDYQEKYSADGAQEWCPPRNLDDSQCARVREAALLAHRQLRCDGLSRSDFILDGRPASEGGGLYFLELNTLPGLTPRSLVPQAAAHDGIDFEQLCQGLIEDALRAPDRSG